MGIPRYALLLLAALGIQAWHIWTELETLDGFKTITVFHVLGFALEVSLAGAIYPLIQ